MVGPSLHNALMTGAAAAQLPLAIHLASEGRWDRGERSSCHRRMPPGAGPTLLMKDEILCSEAWARFDPAEVERLGAGSYAVPFVRPGRRRGDALPLPAQGRGAGRRRGPGPDGPADPLARRRWRPPGSALEPDGRAAQEPNSRIVVMPAQEHVVGHLGCGPSVIASSSTQAPPTGLDTACVAQGAAPAPTFHLP